MHPTTASVSSPAFAAVADSARSSTNPTEGFSVSLTKRGHLHIQRKLFNGLTLRTSFKKQGGICVAVTTDRRTVREMRTMKWQNFSILVRVMSGSRTRKSLRVTVVRRILLALLALSLAKAVRRASLRRTRTSADTWKSGHGRAADL